MAASSQGSQTLNVPIQAVINLLRDPNFHANFKFTYKGEYFGGYYSTFTYSHGVTFTSWGETVTVTVSVPPSNMVQIDIRSECSMPTQIIDWGKNKENVDNIFKFIYANIGFYINALGAFPPPSQPQG